MFWRMRVLYTGCKIKMTPRLFVYSLGDWVFLEFSRLGGGVSTEFFPIGG